MNPVRRKSTFQFPLKWQRFGMSDECHNNNNHYGTIATTGTDVVLEKATKLYKGEALAPMVRASTIPLRTLALRYGADFCYTEELVDRSLSGCTRHVDPDTGIIDYYKDTSKLSAKSKRKIHNGQYLLLRIDPAVEAGRLVCQIGSGEPEFALAAALVVHRDVQGIDLNMGCPKKFSISGGMGSALLSDPDRACRIIRTLTNELTMSSYNPIPVSGKIRLLDTVTATVDFCKGLINAGAKAIAIHGRRPGDLDVKAADWKTLEQTVSILTCKFPTTPILINGDFYTRDEFMGFCDRTGASGVLLARPALYNLSVFRKPTKDKSPPFGYNSPLLMSRTDVIRDYIRESVRYDAYFKNVKYVVSEMMTNRRTPIERVQHMPNIFPGGQTVSHVCNVSSLQEMCKLWDIDNVSSATTLNGSIGDGRLYSDEYILGAEPEHKKGEEFTTSFDPINDVSMTKKRRVEMSDSASRKEAPK